MHQRHLLAATSLLNRKFAKHCGCVASTSSLLITSRNLRSTRSPKDPSTIVEPYSEIEVDVKPPSLLRQVWERIRIREVHDQSLELDTASSHMYNQCSSSVDYVAFVELFGLPDIFETWYRITILHLWMCQVKLQNEMDPDNFVRMRDGLFVSFQKDLRTRLTNLSEEWNMHLVKRANLEPVTATYLESFIEYDEALLTNDAMLAAALFRQLYGYHNPHPVRLSRLVRYVRRQIVVLHKIKLDEFLAKGIDWNKTLRR